MSLHRNRTLTLTAATDATKLTPTKPIPASISSNTTDEQQSKDSTIINHSDSNNPSYLKSYYQNNPTRSDTNIYTNNDIPFMNVLNNDIDIININNNNSPYNNASNDQNKTTDSDFNECNNNSTSINTRPYNPNRDPFLNEYNHELIQPILHREVVSGFSWLHNIKATSTPAYMSNLMNTHATAPEQEAGTSAPAPCEDPYQSHAPDPTTAVTTSKSKNIPTPNPNPNANVKPIEAPMENLTEIFYKNSSIKLPKRQKKQVQICMWSYDQTDTHTPTQVMTPTSTPHVNI
jgi:hypothetical protein